MPIDPTLQAHVVIAASILAGPNASDGEVKRHTERIAGFLAEGSMPMAAFKQLEQRAENTAQVKSFPATIIGVDRETTSTRGVVLLRTKPSEHHPNGQEYVRTERTDSESGRAVAVTLQSLVGHKVFLHVAIERTGTNNVRVVRSWEDKGIDPDYNPADPGWYFDYAALSPSMRAKLATQQQQQQPGYAQPQYQQQGYPQLQPQ